MMNRRAKFLMTLGMAVALVGTGTALAATADNKATSQQQAPMEGKKMWKVQFDTELPSFLGITEEELRSAQQAGQTLAQIAKEKGITEAKLIEFLKTQQQKQIDQLLADGKITQEQADEMKARMTDEHLQEMVNNAKIGGHMGHREKGGIAMSGAFDGAELTKFLGLSEEEFRTALEAGKTLAQIATDKGISEEKLIDFLQAQHQKQIDQLLADGKITQAQADEMKAHHTTEQLREMINNSGGKMGPVGKGMEKGIRIVAFSPELPTFLGLSEEEFRTAQEAGKTLAQIAADKGISEEKLIEFLQTQHQKQIDQLLADGKITQEQADEAKTHFDATHLQDIINNTAPVPGRGSHKVHVKGGFGGFPGSKAQPSVDGAVSKTDLFIAPAAVLID
ncbi:hypothetical protein CIG75_05965 [Tumebacillus algifaecis]|uniref:LysM domain-containing protein n=1 Tax=Tumebacillus algifaecis TaxID=1214604 RepID=A0A223CZL6_9BACL|nr:hypothetical protein [Tumebacillus algifaecis]ASS74583.1 hypothetical protein CIG75_05965 [Tumebacillus algifaecis]